MTEVRPLRAYAEVSLGRQRAPVHDTGPHMIPYLRAANVKDGSLDLSDVKEMNFDPKEQGVFALKPGDVLVTEGSGSLRAVGAASVWSGEVPGIVCFQNTLLRLRPRPSTDPRFLAWWCRYAFGDGLFASIASGANIFHISAERVRALHMTYLVPAHQRAIADYLDTETARIDALIAKKRELGRTLEERRLASILHDVRGLCAQGVSLKRLAHLVDCKHRTPDYVEQGIPVVSPGDVEPGHLDLARCHRFVSREDWADLANGERRPRQGDIIYSRNASVGLAGLVTTDDLFCMGQDVCIVRPLRQDGDGRYLAHVLNTAGLRQIEEIRVGSTFFRINVAQIAELTVPSISEPEQDRFVARWETATTASRDLQARLERQIDLLIEHRQALITAVVTGELKIPGVAA